jgi:hypothetical protein
MGAREKIKANSLAPFGPVLTHKSLGWTQRVSASVNRATINPHSPFPLSPAQEGVSPELNTLERGRGANAAITTTQGGALTRWPWATIRRPSGLKTGSLSGVQPSPVSSKKDMGHDQLLWRRGMND